METVKLEKITVSKDIYLFFKSIINQLNHDLLMFKDKTFLIKIHTKDTDKLNSFCNTYNFSIISFQWELNLMAVLIKSNNETYFEEVYLE